TSPPPNMLAFDAPSREVCVVRRQTTTTPLQPLVLLNDPQFVEAAVALSARMLRDGGPTVADRVTSAFRPATPKRPTAPPPARPAPLYQTQLAQSRREPARVGKSLEGGRATPPAGPDDPADRAAAAVTASVILNLDAAVTAR